MNLHTKIAIIPFLVAPLLVGESCNSITFKKKKLPVEKVCRSTCGPRTLFIPRSQGSDWVIRDAGWLEYLPGCDERTWGNLSVTLNYSHSRKSDRLAQYLFGSTQLTFTGSQVANRGERDLRADDFGLPPTFDGAISFCPTIDNIVLNFYYDIGLDNWYPGLYARFNAPVVTTRWDLGIHCNEKNNIDRQDGPLFPACYMAKDQAVTALSIREALSGDLVFGDMKQPLRFGTFPCGRKSRTGVANIDFIVGWNFLAEEGCAAGVYIQTVAPVGTKIHNEAIFEPVLGNGHLWELGPGFSGHYNLMRSGCHVLSLYWNGSLTRQFEQWQIRSFDLVGHGPLSRYMLLKEYKVTAAPDGRPNIEYADTLINAIDFSTRATRVGGSVKFDGYVKMVYYNDCFGLEAGYNLYARSKEKLRIQPDLFPADFGNRRFGIKGTEGVCYRVFNNETGTVTNQTGILNATQNRSSIKKDAAVDNPAPVLVRPGQTAITWDSSTNPEDLTLAQQSSPPIFISPAMLDITSGAVPHQLTHKVFAHMSYTALDQQWEPQCGLGGMIEFDGRARTMSSLNQWAIWFKASFAY